jgi:hypothetical protein
MPLHPDDVLFFAEVSDIMRKVARHYKLPLRKIDPYPMPDRAMADRLGDCAHDGTIRLVMRATVDGQFVEAPRNPEKVWETAAHELAHLKHMNHGVTFQEFELEMRQAVENARGGDHRQKVIDKLLKLQASREGEARLGNSAAAEAFAGMINKMMLEHELHPSDLDYARAADDDPIVEVKTDLSRYRIDAKHTRIAWQENLARIVANAHLCKFLIRTGSNDITFVGTRSHAVVAEYAFGTLVNAAKALSWEAYVAYGKECAKAEGRGRKWVAAERGFIESWLAAFTGRIEERMQETRRAAVAEAARDVPGGESMALMRLDGALTKAARYIDDKFKGKAAPLTRVHARHAEGRRRGRAAADAMTIGRRGVTSGTKGLLK